jgi:hypothetical protein
MKNGILFFLLFDAIDKQYGAYHDDSEQRIVMRIRGGNGNRTNSAQSFLFASLCAKKPYKALPVTKKAAHVYMRASCAIAIEIGIRNTRSA